MINHFIDNLVVRWRRALWLVLAGSFLVGCSGVEGEGTPGPKTKAGSQQARDERTALDIYVAAPDTNYNYRLVTTVPAKGQTSYVLEMTSQVWLTTNEVDRPLWKHWLTIVRPDTVAHSTALLFITGGANVFPAEVECALAEHVNIADVVVIGLSDPWSLPAKLKAAKRIP